MDIQSLADKIIQQLNAETLEGRLLVFLSDPKKVDSPAGRRVLELLDIASQRQAAANTR